MYVRTYVCMYVSMHVCMYVSMYVYRVFHDLWTLLQEVIT